MKTSEFIKHIITFDNVTDILKECPDDSNRGFTFEKIFDIIIKFGFCEYFDKTYVNMSGNINLGKLKTLTTIDKYLNSNVISSKSSGCVDIILKKEDTYIFISSKHPKLTEEIKKQKSVDYYDIQKIIAVIDENKHIYKKFEIYLLVPDKHKVLKKVKSANETSKYITKYMEESNILDLTDLNKYFFKFKKSIIKNMDNNWNDIYFTKKEKLILRFHQELITNKTSDLIEKGYNTFLWGCKCRSGKTYMAGGIILKQQGIKETLNVLIITPAPTETVSQFIDGLFIKFDDFKQFKIHDIKDSKMIKNIELSKNNIFVISKQLLQNYINDETILTIKKLKLDIIIFDEVHFTGTTDISKYILSSYSSKNTVKIYLTATYNKPLKEWNIKQECQMFWDLEDEQICKNILDDKTNLGLLKEKHGEKYIDKTIEYYEDLNFTINDIFKSYKNMPNLSLITNLFDKERYEELKKDLKCENKFGFCFDTLFSLNKTKNKFEYEKEVKIFLRYISGSKKEKDGDKTIFTRITHICSENESRYPFTQIWFLPSNNINEISKWLKVLMKEDMILKQYSIFCINRKNKDLAKDIKDEITKKETKAKNKGKLGVILLAGNMLTLGITLDLCDLVILMNNTLSSDKVMQQMYRCMTEEHDKKYGFVVDLSLSRVLNTCVNYTIYGKDTSIEDKITYLIKRNLINIDMDMLDNKKINSDIIIKKLMKIWKNDPINSFKTLLKNLDDDYEEFDNATQKLLNKSFTKNIKDNKINVKIVFKDEYDEKQELPTGKEYEEIKKDKSDKDKVKKEEEIKISFTKDVLPFIIPLTCILTIKQSNTDFVKMLNCIKDNPDLLEIFDEQCLIWFNKNNLIDLIKSIIEKYFDKKSNTYNISIQFKMSLKSLIDTPKELLELINECLKPKDVEKKMFGEVFTPINLVNEMLDKLPKDVWINKKLKWFDPASGMGNFPIAVYLRLMDGLKDKIKDDKKRKKHILEKMIYMSELNKKNCFVIQQIFNINDEYKLNLYCGDTLKSDFNKIFNVAEFDIIVGNPPYNASGTKASGNTIWQLFVNNSINLLKQNGYICFVHPNGWRKPNTEKGKFYGLFKKMTNENTLLYLEIHDVKDGMKHFNCGTRYDWYILQKKKNESHKTKIIDQNNVSYEINLNKYNWLANCYLDLIDKLIANEYEEKCKILQSMSAYEPRKKWISKTENKEFKYPVVHSTPKNGHRFVWSNKNDNGFYGVKKVIFGESGIYNPIVDIDGKYAMSQGAMAIIIDNIKEGKKLAKFLCSSIFNKIIKACLWSSFRIEWGMFKDLKKNFYELLDDKI